MTGDDARKNTFGGLAGVAAATAGDETRDVVVIGMAGTGDRVHHWSIAAAMRPGEARTAERISDEEMDALLADASVVVVPSFDEGLSLPVIEALRAGAPVVASDIPAHRELIGTGSFLADPRSPGSLAKAVSATAGKSGVRDRQLQRLQAHRHADLETVIADRVLANLRTAKRRHPGACRVRRPAAPERRHRRAVAAAAHRDRRLHRGHRSSSWPGCATSPSTRRRMQTWQGRCRLMCGSRSGRIDDVIADGHPHDVFVSVVGQQPLPPALHRGRRARSTPWSSPTTPGWSSCTSRCATVVASSRSCCAARAGGRSRRRWTSRSTTCA